MKWNMSDLLLYIPEGWPLNGLQYYLIMMMLLQLTFNNRSIYVSMPIDCWLLIDIITRRTYLCLLLSSRRSWQNSRLPIVKKTQNWKMAKVQQQCVAIGLLHNTSSIILYTFLIRKSIIRLMIFCKNTATLCYFWS